MSVVARFDSAENDALESLVELYGALLQSIAEISKEYCEHGNRVVPLIQDVISAWDPRTKSGQSRSKNSVI